MIYSVSGRAVKGKGAWAVLYLCPAWPTTFFLGGRVDSFHWTCDHNCRHVCDLTWQICTFPEYTYLPTWIWMRVWWWGREKSFFDKNVTLVQWVPSHLSCRQMQIDFVVHILNCNIRQTLSFLVLTRGNFLSGLGLARPRDKGTISPSITWILHLLNLGRQTGHKSSDFWAGNR